MKLAMFVFAVMMMLGCGSTPSGTGGAGGTGGDTSTASTGGSGGSTAGTGGHVGPFSPDKIPVAMNANDIAVGIDQGKCITVGPLTSEDGSWTRVVMRPWGGMYGAVHIAAVSNPNIIVPNPWMMSIGVVTSSLDPADYSCEQNPTPREMLVVDEVSGVDPEGNASKIQILRTSFATGSQEDGDAMIACIRNTADPVNGSTALVMCGDAGSGDPDRDFWQDSADDGGAITPMCGYGKSLCRTWMVVPQK